MDKKTQKAMFSSKNDSWGTPPWLFDILHKQYKFTLDAAASDSNHLLDRYWTKESNSLVQPWDASTYCNPPYSMVAKFIDKGIEEAKKGRRTVFLVPSRTDTKWFERAFLASEEVFFLKGRLKFGDEKNSAPFPSCILVLGPRPRVVKIWDPRVKV